MFDDNRLLVLRECDRCNELRRVRNGSVDDRTFFHNIRGDLLISGCIAEDTEMLSHLIQEYAQRGDMPTILLSGHRELFQILREILSPDRMVITDPFCRNFHPFYGMSSQKLLHFIHLTAESLGYHATLDRILSYASAVLNVVEKVYPVSLPALMSILENDDDFISSYALDQGLSNVVADVIRGNHEAGINLRRVLEKLLSVFEETAVADSDTKYNFISGVSGNQSLMAFYSISSEQALMNEYLKEELFHALKRVPKLRVIVEEPVSDHEEKDELLSYLFRMKRQGKIELIFLSQNAGEAAEGMSLNFSNAMLSRHQEPVFLEELSKALWGTYTYNYPIPVAGKPPALLFTLKTSVQWHIATEERLKVRAIDLIEKRGLFIPRSDLLAIKTGDYDNIYLVPAEEFLPRRKELKKREELTS